MINAVVETSQRTELTAILSQRLRCAAESEGYGVFPTSNLRFTVTALALSLMAVSGRPVLAQTADLTVTAEVQANCTLNGGTLPFGVYTGDENDATGNFSYQCTPGTDITLSLNQGANEQTGVRTMAGSNGGSLPYQLYSDSSHTTLWGADGDGFVVEGTSAEEETAQVYGRILAGEQVPAGDYSDTVQITLTINP